MRRNLTACRTGIAVVAAVVLLSACGGSEKGNSASGSSEAGSSAPETSAPAAGSEFCTRAAAIQERVDATFNDRLHITALPQSLQETALAVREVEPPNEIAADWATLADGLEQLGAALSEVRLNDPNAAAAAQDEVVTPLLQQFAVPSANVAAYLGDECGLEADLDESDAPSG